MNELLSEEIGFERADVHPRLSIKIMQDLDRARNQYSAWPLDPLVHEFGLLQVPQAAAQGGRGQEASHLPEKFGSIIGGRVGSTRQASRFEITLLVLERIAKQPSVVNG